MVLISFYESPLVHAIEYDYKYIVDLLLKQPRVDPNVFTTYKCQNIYWIDFKYLIKFNLKNSIKMLCV